MPIQAPAPSLAGRMLIAALKAHFEALDRAIDAAGEAYPQSGDQGRREFALAKTNLEQASMWASKACCLAFPEPEEA